MARTRNRQMKQAEAFVQASPKKIWKAGIYTRISMVRRENRWRHRN